MKSETLIPAVLEVNLTIADPAIIKYLDNFLPEQREEKLMEAVRIGVIAIQSASPTLDTKAVEEKFREVETTIDAYLGEFKKEVSDKMEEHFKAGSGTVPRSLDKIFGDKGQLASTLKEYISSEGKISLLLKEHIGPNSEFAKSIDPKNKGSVLSQIENLVKEHLQKEIGEVVKQFSMDAEDSSLSKMHRKLDEKIDAVKAENSRLLGEIKEAIGVNKGKKEEAEKGTEKGREFELKLYEDFVAPLADELDDTTQLVRGTPGLIARCKKGDYVITLGDSSAAPGKKITVEVKNGDNYNLTQAMEELQVAKENRGAEAGIFVFTKGNEPAEVGDFKKIGNDLYVTVDAEKLEAAEPLLFLEAAYKICRVMIAVSARAAKASELDLDKVHAGLDTVKDQVESMSDIIKAAQVISKNSRAIEETAAEVADKVNKQLKAILEMIDSSAA